jgi:cupin 2 domain-containing protein
MQSKNLLELIPQNLDQEVFEEIVNSASVRIERIISKGHTSPNSGWYDQEENEWILILEGSAILAFEDGSRCDLAVGDYLTIPAHLKHRVAWTPPGEVTVWLAIFYR